MLENNFDTYKFIIKMTHQDFNHIFYQFTGSKKGIKPTDQLKTTGKELKDFVEFALRKINSNLSNINTN